MFPLMLIYLFLVIIRPQDYPGAVGANWPWQQGILIAAAVVWLLNARKTFEAPQYLLLLLFFAVMVLSQAANGWAGGAVYVANLFVPIILAFMLLAHACESRERTRIVMAVLTACAAVLAVHGIEQVRTGTGWTGVGLSEETRIQYVGIFNDPNDLGLLFIMCLPMALYLSSRGGLLGLRRIFWLAIAGLLLYGIFLTNSRGTLLAMLVVLFVYLWRKRGLFVAGLLGAAALGGLMMLPSRLQDVDVSEESAFGRVDSWYEGMQMFISNPIFGVGPGNYTDYNTLTAHNSFVLVLAETGYFGFMFWLAFIGYCLWMTLTVMRCNDSDFLEQEGDDAEATLVAAWQADRGIAFTLLLSLCGFLAAAFFLSRSYVITLYLLAAMVVGHYEGMRARYPWLPRFRLSDDILRWAFLSVAAIIALFLLVKILFATA